jgi:tetratricopeptide (TPR) repeat protein
MDLKCKSCGEDVVYAPRDSDFAEVVGHVRGQCQCVRDFWASSKRSKLSKISKLIELAEQGNVAAMACIELSELELGLEVKPEDYWLLKAAEYGDHSAQMLCLMESEQNQNWRKSIQIAQLMVRSKHPGGYSAKVFALEKLGLEEEARETTLEGAFAGDYFCILSVHMRYLLNSDEPILEEIANATLRLGKGEAAFTLGEKANRVRNFEMAKKWLTAAFSVAITSAIGKPDTAFNSEVYFADCQISKNSLISELGLALFELGEWQAVITLYSEFIGIFHSEYHPRVFQDYVKSHDRFAYALQSDGNFAEAEKYWARAADLEATYFS